MTSLEKINDFGDTFNIMQADERNRMLTREDVPLFDIKSFKEAVINAYPDWTTYAKNNNDKLKEESEA